MSDTQTDSDSERTDDELLSTAQDLVEGLWSGQVLHAAVRVGLVDRLDEEPTAAETLAADLDLDPDATYRLLRALSHFGVLSEDDSRRFALTTVGQFFRADPAMSHRQADALLGVLEESDGSQFDRVCDVGGGQGYLCCRLLERYRELDGIVFDRPSVVAEVPGLPEEFGVTDRCDYVGGDMFESVPAADAYVLKWILHDWTDEECVDILSNVRDAAPADARLFVLEAVVPGPEQSHFAKKLDVAMLAHMGGRERTRAEYQSLLDRAGWSLADQWISPEGPMQVLEARPG